MGYLDTSLWPDVLSSRAQIEFWLDSPEVHPNKAAVTRAALDSKIGNAMLKTWLNLYTYLGRARGKGPNPATADVTDFCQELLNTGQLDIPELQKIRHRLTLATVKEFEWHKERIRKVVQARLDEAESKAA